MIRGYDVSSYQEDRYPVAGIDFVIIKVTEGTSYTSPKWVAQRKWARRHNLSVGFYHFAQAGSMRAQAEHFLSKITLAPGDHLWFDWEVPGVSSADKDAWIRYVQEKAPGHRVGLYCNRDYWLHKDASGFFGDALWIAQYNDKAGQPDIKSKWAVHQYTSDPIDTNLANFASRAQMIDWARKLGEDDHVALSDADKKYIKDTVTTVLHSDAYGATLGRDAARAPDDSASNPTWRPDSYQRETYLRLLEIKRMLSEQTPAPVPVDLEARLSAIEARLTTLEGKQ